eukprot:363790-Chlamydomonas_euryale.AAC.18
MAAQRKCRSAGPATGHTRRLEEAHATRDPTLQQRQQDDEFVSVSCIYAAEQAMRCEYSVQ